jgi:hypothetical protein
MELIFMTETDSRTYQTDYIDPPTVIAGDDSSSPEIDQTSCESSLKLTALRCRNNCDNGT